MEVQFPSYFACGRTLIFVRRPMRNRCFPLQSDPETVSKTSLKKRVLPGTTEEASEPDFGSRTEARNCKQTVPKNGSKFGTLSRGLTPALLGSRSDCEADFLGFEQNMGEISIWII